MKCDFLNTKILAFVFVLGGLLASCSSDDDELIPTPDPTETRWITVAAARMGENPGDGNGGTLIYAINSEEAKTQQCQSILSKTDLSFHRTERPGCNLQKMAIPFSTSVMPAIQAETIRNTR